MADWLSGLHLRWVANYKILQGELIRCSTVDLLLFFSYLLLSLLLLKLVFHILVYARLRRSSRPFSHPCDSAFLAVYERVLSGVGLKRAIPIYAYSGGPYLAFTIGTFRPSIFVSPRLLVNLETEEVEAILTHELIHVRRHDNLRRWGLECVFASLPLLVIQLFANTFVFSLRNSLLAVSGTFLLLILVRYLLKGWAGGSREQTCDDHTVAITGKPLALASSLVKAWRLIRGSSVLPGKRFLATHYLIEHASCLESRVGRLVDYRKPRFKIMLTRLSNGFASVALAMTLLFLFRYHVLNSYADVTVRNTCSELFSPYMSNVVCPSPDDENSVCKVGEGTIRIRCNMNTENTSDAPVVQSF